MFTAVITSFVSDIILPPLSVLLPLNKNLEEKFAVLRSGTHRDKGGVGYNTLSRLRMMGLLLWRMGEFLFVVWGVMSGWVVGLINDK